MAALTENDILGRRIDLLAITPPLDLTVAPQTIFTVGLSNLANIVPNPVTGGANISHVSLQLTAGAAQSNTQISLGTTFASSYTDWGGSSNASGFSVSPWMFYANNSGSFARPGIYPLGTRFTFTWASQPFVVGTLGVFRIYGWME